MSGPEQKSAKRGRPRSFDAGQAIESAAAVFWRNGYAATSLDEIGERTGLHRPSLAAAFGDKRRLYLEALAGYRRAAREKVADALSRPTLREALGTFFSHGLGVYLSGTPSPLGCLIIGTSVAEAGADEATRAFLAETLAELDEALAVRFAEAQAAGELAAGADTTALARVASSVLYALAIKARAGVAASDLRAMAAGTVDLICRA